MKDFKIQVEDKVAKKIETIANQLGISINGLLTVLVENAFSEEKYDVNTVKEEQAIYLNNDLQVGKKPSAEELNQTIEYLLSKNAELYKRLA